MDIPLKPSRLVRYWRSASLCLVLCLGIAASITLAVPPTYEATTSVLLAVDRAESTNDLVEGASYAESQTRGFAEIATTQRVLDPVIEALGIAITADELADDVRVTQLAETSVIHVETTAGDARGAADLSRAVAASLIDAIVDLSPPDASDRPLVRATVLDEATVPKKPRTPRAALNLALGGMLGVLVGLGQALVRGRLDTTVRDANDVSRLTDAPLLGTVRQLDIASMDAQLRARAVRLHDDEVRKLRTNMTFAGGQDERVRSIAITSSIPNEGKSTTAISLASALAASGKTVLLIDGNLRRPELAHRLRLIGSHGLTDVLAGTHALRDVVTRLHPTPLHVLPAGSMLQNPCDLVGSQAMTDLLAEAERDFDFVLVDTPPLLPVSDGLVIADQVDGVILVARAGFVSQRQVEEALGNLDNGSIRTLGVVLTGAPPGRRHEYGFDSRRAAQDPPRHADSPRRASRWVVEAADA